MAHFASAVQLTSELQDRLQVLGKRKQRPTTQLLEEAVRRYLDTEEEKNQFRQETEASMKDYRETGLYLNNDDVMAWMDTWGTDEEAGPPPWRKRSTGLEQQ